MVDLIREVARAGVPKEAAFPRSEYESRVSRLRRSMEAEGIEVLLVHNVPNICYLTGYLTQMSNWYACLVLPLDGEPFVHVVEGEATLVLLHGWIEDVITIAWDRTSEAPMALARFLKDRGYHRKRIGFDMAGFGVNTATYLTLKEKLSEALFQDASRLVSQLRLVKSPPELQHMREAARITDIGMTRAMAEVQVGKTENDVAAAGYSAMVRAGSEHLSQPPLVTTGQRTSLGPHLTWKRTPLDFEDPISVELSSAYFRYGAPALRCAVLGTASDQIRRLSEASLETASLLTENARPGMIVHELCIAAKKGLGPLASEAHFGGIFGYSVGLGMVPAWSEHSLDLAEGVERALEPGMAFYSPIYLTIPGQVGIGFGDTWIVTETGCDVLTNAPRELSATPL